MKTKVFNYCNSGGLKLINKGKLQTSILHNLFSVFNARNELWMREKREKHNQMQLASDFVSSFLLVVRFSTSTVLATRRDQGSVLL